jgi:hypothetical protein
MMRSEGSSEACGVGAGVGATGRVGVQFEVLTDSQDWIKMVHQFYLLKPPHF